MNIKEEREFIQELLEQGKLDSLSVQVISLVRFANQMGWKAVNNDPRKGFYKKQTNTSYLSRAVTKRTSLSAMMGYYNNCYHFGVYSKMKIVERIGLHYNKKTGKLFTQKHWLKFVKEV